MARGEANIRDCIAGGLLFAGTVGLAGIVCSYSSLIPAGNMSWQWFCVGRMAVFFSVCCVSGAVWSSKKVCLFRQIVVYSLICTGLVEVVDGFGQAFGCWPSHHSLYAVTGSFYNPGPYSGYLALVFPVCLHEWLRLNKAGLRTGWQKAGWGLSLAVLSGILVILPAAMSRASWVALAVSTVFVVGNHYSLGKYLKTEWHAHRFRTIGVSCVFLFLAAVSLWGLYTLKENSAKGRFLMWRLSCVAVMEKPFTGHGADSFVQTYGQVQEDYFAKGRHEEWEEMVAGSPEYAFNEYLRVAVEYGVVVLGMLLLVVFYCMRRGYRGGENGLVGGIISLSVFAFFSYPLEYPGFIVALLLMLTACVFGSSWKKVALSGIVIGFWGACLMGNNRFEYCKVWNRCLTLYKMKAYQEAEEGYARLYPALKDDALFLADYSLCLSACRKYDRAIEVLEEAEKRSCNAMILNSIGKIYQIQGKYREAEKSYIRSTHRLPARIYPYYLLAKLYADSDYYHPEKFKRMAYIVLYRKPKVHSKAIDEMREEIRKTGSALGVELLSGHEEE